MIVAARSGGADPAASVRPRQAIDKAEASGVPDALMAELASLV